MVELLAYIQAFDTLDKSCLVTSIVGVVLYIAVATFDKTSSTNTTSRATVFLLEMLEHFSVGRERQRRLLHRRG